MTEDHVIVFADADPPMMPLMVGERLARVQALGAFAVHESQAADAADYEARIADATAIMIGWGAWFCKKPATGKSMKA